jgi:hypothetical protein
MGAPGELETENPGAVRAHPRKRRKLGHTEREHQASAKPKQTPSGDTLETISKGSTRIFARGSKSHDAG